MQTVKSKQTHQIEWGPTFSISMINCNDFGYCHHSKGQETKELRWVFVKVRDMWSCAKSKFSLCFIIMMRAVKRSTHILGFTGLHNEMATMLS